MPADVVKILIVDDLPEKILVYRSVLEEPGLEIVVATSGAEALRYLLRDEFAVILLDVNMPGMDGFETASLIRARKRCAHMPIIFVTAHSDEMHARRGYAYGAVDYILTPVVPEVLRTKVRVFVDLFRLNMQVREQAAWQLAQARGEQARLSAVLENAADFVGQADAQGRLIHINVAGRRMIGRSATDPLPPHMGAIQPHWATRLIVEQGVPTAVKDGVWFGESALLGEGGVEIPVAQLVLAHRDAAGTVDSISFIAGDISERKKAEAALTESERRYRQLIHGMPAAVYTCDVTGRITLYNPAAAVLWGRKPQIGKDMWCGSWRIFRPDGTPLPPDECPMAIALREGRVVRDVEIIIERPDGTRCHVLPHPEPIYDDTGTIIGAINVLIDVTERKRADETRALLAAIVDSTDDVVISMSLEGLVTSFNRAAERLFGHPAEDVVGRSITMLIPPERREEETVLLGRIRRGERVEHFETVRVAKGGRRIEVSLTISPMRDHRGVITGASKIARDITDQKRAEALMRESESRLRTMFGQAAVGIVLLDLQTRFLQVNGRMSQIVGRTVEDLCTVSCELLTHPQDWPAHRSMIAQVIAGERADCSMEKRYRRGDGSWIWANVTISPLFDEHGRIYRLMSIVEDISARKIAEQEVQHHRQHLEQLVGERTAELEATHERLRVADRLASMGTLAAGVGHDMGNLLLPLRMRLESLEALDLPAESKEEIAGIRTSAEYLQRLANGLRLLVLDPDRDRARGLVELYAWWNDVFPMLRNAAPHPIAIQHDFPPGECWLGVAPAALTQMVFNLVQNAGNALKERGRGTIRIIAQRAAGGLRLSITDDGPGMNEEVRRRCMEPFFTTRPRGVSTGLGLSLVYGLIKQVGGSVELESAPGVGTAFVMTLPVAPPPTAAEGDDRLVAAVDVRDLRLRALVTAELARLDFDVQGAADDQPDGEICRLLVTDEQDEDLLRRMTEQYPRRRIALLGPSPGNGLGERITATGAKPNTIAVREMLKALADSRLKVKDGTARG